MEGERELWEDSTGKKGLEKGEYERRRIQKNIAIYNEASLV